MNGSPAPAAPSYAAAADLAFRTAMGGAPPGPIRAPAPPIPPPAAAGPAPTPFAWTPPPGFEPVPQDFLLYHPDYSDGRAIFGVLVDAIPVAYQHTGAADGTVVPALHGLIVQLIEETLVLDPSASRRIVAARPGQEIMVVADHLALRRLVRAGLDANGVAEVWLRPDPEVRLTYGPDHYAAWIVRFGKMFPRKAIKRTGAA